MTPQEAVARIESLEFSVQYNVCSGLENLLSSIEQDEAFKILDVLPSDFDALKDDEWGCKLCVWHRAISIADTPADLKYEHPHDMAVATYLWLLRNTPPWRLLAASFVLSDRASNWFWARRIAREKL